MESERSTPSQINELKALTMPRVWPISGGALFRHQIVVTLASLYPLSSWSGGRRSVDTLVSEQCPGERPWRPARRLSAAAPGAGTRPRARLGAAPAQHASRTMHEQAPAGVDEVPDLHGQLTCPFHLPHPNKGIVRLNLLGRLSLSPFGDFRAQRHVLSGLDRTSTGDEAGSTTGKF